MSTAWSSSTRDTGSSIDNLLDLSHETFLHADLIGTPEVAESPITTSIDRNGVSCA